MKAINIANFTSAEASRKLKKTALNLQRFKSYFHHSLMVFSSILKYNPRNQTTAHISEEYKRETFAYASTFSVSLCCPSCNLSTVSSYKLSL